MGGLAVLLLAHVAYTVAFWTTGPSLLAALAALVGFGAAGAVTIR